MENQKMANHLMKEAIKYAEAPTLVLKENYNISEGIRDF